MKNFSIIITTTGNGLSATIRSLYKKRINSFHINIISEWLKMKDISLLKSEFQKLRQYLKQNKNIQIDRINSTLPKKPGCGICDRILVRPDGTIVPCEGFINSKNKLHLLGDLKKDKLKKSFFYDGKLDEKIPFCQYFDETNGRPLNAKEFDKRLRREIATKKIYQSKKIC